MGKLHGVGVHYIDPIYIGEIMYIPMQECICTYSKRHINHVLLNSYDVGIVLMVCSVYMCTDADGVSSLDDKGCTAERDNYEVSNVLPPKTTSHQYDLSSSSDLDDEILPLFRRIQLQPKKSNNDTVMHHKTTNIHGTLDFPIVID